MKAIISYNDPKSVISEQYRAIRTNIEYSNVDKNTTNKTTQISGKGTVTVYLTITDSDGGNWTRSQSINLNNTSSISF